MRLEMLLGAMTNLETQEYGNPYEVIENIKYAKERGIDILIGPEWSLTCPPGVFSKSMIKGKKISKVIDILFNAPDYIEYAPRDAKKILIEKADMESDKFNDYPYIPHSKKEFEKILTAVAGASKNSGMLIYPGTAMSYDKDRILYNVMPVIKDGKVLKAVYKFNDGLGSKFNLEGSLMLYPSETSKDPDYSLSYGKDPIIDFNGIKTSVEICADAGILKEHGINNLDLQVLSSCGNSSTVSAVNNRGYIAVVDGLKEPEVKVIRKYVPRLKPVERNERMKIFSLEFYVD
jgi:hypothetical protein